jgi:hypothetical protein
MGLQKGEKISRYQLVKLLMLLTFCFALRWAEPNAQSLQEADHPRPLIAGGLLQSIGGYSANFRPLAG